MRSARTIRHVRSFDRHSPGARSSISTPVRVCRIGKQPQTVPGAEVARRTQRPVSFLSSRTAVAPGRGHVGSGSSGCSAVDVRPADRDTDHAQQLSAARNEGRSSNKRLKCNKYTLWFFDTYRWTSYGPPDCVDRPPLCCYNRNTKKETPRYLKIRTRDPYLLRESVRTVVAHQRFDTVSIRTVYTVGLSIRIVLRLVSVVPPSFHVHPKYPCADHDYSVYVRKCYRWISFLLTDFKSLLKDR